MSGAEQDRKRAARAEQVALFRYQLIREAADPSLSTRQRGRLVRQAGRPDASGAVRRPGDRIAGDDLTGGSGPGGPGGSTRWCRQPGRSRRGPRAEVLELAAALKRENPERTAAQVERILRTPCGWAPSDRTLQRLFERLELTTPPRRSRAAVFGRFEAARPNELWTGDALHGPEIAGRKTYLFAFIDDHSRAVMAARWGFAEDTVRLAAALRPALAARGVPEYDLRR